LELGLAPDVIVNTRHQNLEKLLHVRSSILRLRACARVERARGFLAQNMRGAAVEFNHTGANKLARFLPIA
jgi:hypothetical protein